MIYQLALFAILAVSCCSCSTLSSIFNLDPALKIEISKDAIPQGSNVTADVKIVPPELPPKTVRVSSQG